MNETKMRRAARRAAAIREGGLHAWRGGLAHVIPDKKKAASKRACRNWRTNDS